MRLQGIIIISGLLLLSFPGVASGQIGQTRHESISAVPTLKPMKIDGLLNEWDLSGMIECYLDEALRKTYSARLALMYHSRALYLAAQFKDPMPMPNRNNPEIEAFRGWSGDALQMRISSDPALGYPLKNPRDLSERVCHLTFWYLTDKQLPALHINYGMNFRDDKVLVGKNSGIAFCKDADGKGYTLEARIP